MDCDADEEVVMLPRFVSLVQRLHNSRRMVLDMAKREMHFRVWKRIGDFADLYTSSVRDEIWRLQKHLLLEMQDMLGILETS